MASTNNNRSINHYHVRCTMLLLTNDTVVIKQWHTHELVCWWSPILTNISLITLPCMSSNNNNSSINHYHVTVLKLAINQWHHCHQPMTPSWLICWWSPALTGITNTVHLIILTCHWLITSAPRKKKLCHQLMTYQEYLTIRWWHANLSVSIDDIAVVMSSVDPDHLWPPIVWWHRCYQLMTVWPPAISWSENYY